MLQLLKSIVSDLEQGLLFVARVEVKTSVTPMSMLARSGVLLKLNLTEVISLGGRPIGIHILSSLE